MLKRLRNKLLIICMGITLTVLFAAFTAVYITTSERMNAENELKLKDAAFYMRTNIPSDDVGIIYDSSPAAFSANSPIFTVVTDKHGTITKKYSALDLPENIYEEATQFALQSPAMGEPVKIADRLWLYTVSNDVTTAPVGENGITITGVNTLITFLDVTETSGVLRDLLLTFVIVGTVMIVVVFLTSLYFANRSIKPVELMLRKQRQFVADASHELKTPLSIITSNYDALLANEHETIKSQREWLDYIKSGTDRMAKLIGDLLTLTRIESTGLEVSRAPFDISLVIQETIQQFEAQICKKSISVSQSIEPNIEINSDRAMIEQVLDILYDNAVKYTNEGGTISVKLEQKKHQVVYSIGNSGPSIDKADLPRIFDRFYRADTSRSGETGGYGLGLSIAQTIMLQLGGEIKATSKMDWTVFTITLNVIV